MCAAIFSSIAAWLIGMFIDANVSINPLGFTEFRILFPILTMGGFILHSVKNNN